MHLDPEIILSNPLLHALLGKPPKGVMPRLYAARDPEKRMRPRIESALRRAPGGLQLAGLRHATGLQGREITATLAKMIAMREVRSEVVGKDRWMTYFWSGNGT